MDWEAEGLLDGVEGDEARAARRALLDELHDSGVGLDELRRAVDEDRLALLPVERLLGSEPCFNAREVAEQSGMDLEFFEASRRALGLPWPGPDAKAFNVEDVEAAKLGAEYRRAGFADAEAIEVTRVLGQGMARYAEATRTMAAHTFLEPGIDEHELARRYAVVAQGLLPMAGPWLGHVFKMHLRQVLRQDAITREQLESGRFEDARPTAVAFADLVGFTSLGETVELEELTGVAQQLTAIAQEAIDEPVHLVKQIGDAVMLVSPDPAAMVDAVLRLVDASGDGDLPPLRAGVAYGPAINRWGDWFGSTVNVASRLTARARPASVLVTEAVRERVGDDGYSWSSAGPKKLRGLSTPIKTYRVRPAE